MHGLVSHSRRRDVPVGDRADELLPDCRLQGAEGHDPGESSERAEERRVRKRTPEMLAGEIRCGNRDDVRRPESCREVAEPQLGEVSAGVDEDVAVVDETCEQVGLVNQCRVLHDDDVRIDDGLANPNRQVVDAAIGDDRRTCAFRPERRERLSMTPVHERGDREELRGRHDSLAAASVESQLVHARVSVIA